MELRLKEDILKEAALHDGQLLIAREVMGSEDGQSASIVDEFVPIQGEALVQNELPSAVPSFVTSLCQFIAPPCPLLCPAEVLPCNMPA